MQKVSKETFLMALNSPIAQIKSCEYGNSLFGDLTMLVKRDGLYFIAEYRSYYKQFETISEENFFKFDSKKEALTYFKSCQEYAEAYCSNNNTVAGGN